MLMTGGLWWEMASFIPVLLVGLCGLWAYVKPFKFATANLLLFLSPASPHLESFRTLNGINDPTYSVKGCYTHYLFDTGLCHPLTVYQCWPLPNTQQWAFMTASMALDLWFTSSQTYCGAPYLHVNTPGPVFSCAWTFDVTFHFCGRRILSLTLVNVLCLGSAFYPFIKLNLKLHHVLKFDPFHWFTNAYTWSLSGGIWQVFFGLSSPVHFSSHFALFLFVNNPCCLYWTTFNLLQLRLQSVAECTLF